MNTHSRQRHCKHKQMVIRYRIVRCVICGAVLTNSENFAETVVKVLQSKNKGSDEMTDTATFKVGDMVEVVGPFAKGSDLNVMVGLGGTIVGIDYRCVKVSLENGVWDFPARKLCHAKAETSQPTPTEQLRAIAQADDNEGIDGLTDEEIDREVNYQLGFAQRRVEILTGELAAMEERAERAEADLEAYKARKTSINPWPWRNWRKK